MTVTDAPPETRPAATPTRLPVNDLARRLEPLRGVVDRALHEVLARGSFVQGPEVARFERAFAQFCETTHCVGVANGTDALELALRAVGVQPGDGVVTVANAGMYGSAAILAAGARPTYVDVDPTTLTMDVDGLDRALGRRGPAGWPSAVVVTHLYGVPVDMPAVLDVAQRYAVAVVEDCAQAHGATVGGRSVGSFGDAGAFSFYPTQNLGAVGDAGAVVTSRRDVAAALRSLRQHGSTEPHTATTAGGRSSLLDEVQAAVLRALLPQVDGWTHRRRAIVTAYARGIDHPQVQVGRRGGPGDAGHLFVLRTRDRAGLRAHLDACGIATDVHYPVPDHRQEAVLSVLGAMPPLPVTEAACQEVLTVPCYPELTDQEVAAVIAAINAWRPAQRGASSDR